jgi:hypothetical protein
MTISLYVKPQVYPNANSSPRIYVAIYLASHFFNPPVGNQQPPQGSTPIASGTSNNLNTTLQLTGLSESSNYWLLVQNPQGYTHWFYVDWTSGLTSGDPMIVGVPLIEGVFLKPTHGTWATTAAEP